MLVSKMELKEYLLKRNKELEEEIEQIKKFNKEKGGDTPYQSYEEQLNDNKRLLREKC